MTWQISIKIEPTFLNNVNTSCLEQLINSLFSEKSIAWVLDMCELYALVC